MSTSISQRGLAAHHLVREVGLTGAVVVSWTSAGSVLLGGVWPALRGMTGDTLPGGWLISTGWFVLGALLGLLHGAVLGVIGRRHRKSVSDAWNAVGISAMYTLPAIAILWGVAGVVALTTSLWDPGNIARMVAVIASWGIVVAVTGGAVVQGTRALLSAFRRWPEWPVGTAATILAFVAVLSELLSPAPRVFWYPIRPLPEIAVVLSFVIAAWFVGPGVTLGLRQRRYLAEQPALGFSGSPLHRLIGLASALIAAPLLAIPTLVAEAPPLHVPPFTLGVSLEWGIARAAEIVVILGVVMRLAIVTTVLSWLRRNRLLGPGMARFLAVVVGATIETAVHLPGVLSLGIPGAGATWGFVLGNVALPAAVLGYLYLHHGWAASLLAHAGALAMVIVVGVTA